MDLKLLENIVAIADYENISKAVWFKSTTY